MYFRLGLGVGWWKMRGRWEVQGVLREDWDCSMSCIRWLREGDITNVISIAITIWRFSFVKL